MSYLERIVMITSMDEREFTQNEIELYEGHYMTVFKRLAEMVKTTKQIEEDEKKIKEQIEKSMDEFGIKSIDNQYINITRVAAGSNKVTIDLDAFMKAEPNNYAELLADYPKEVKGRAAYVTFKIK